MFDLIEKLLKRWREGGHTDDKSDAFIDSILPELEDWFLELFKEGDSASFFAKLNQFILLAYMAMPSFVQFAVRYFANVRLERLQTRWRWLSTPIMIFFKGYFNALEKASKGRTPASADELRAALDEVAADAKNAASELGKKFTAAWEAAKKINKPKPPGAEEGPDMPHDPHPPPPGPAAGGTGDKAKAPKKGFAEMANQAKEVWGILTSLIGWAADRSEDHVQSAANGSFWAAMALLATGVTTTITAFLDNDRLMMVNVGWWAMVWIVGPFVALWAWRDRNRQIHEAAEAEKPEDERNPYEQAGNGFLEIGALAGAIAFVGLVSTLVVAILCAVATYSHFASAYVWSGLIAIGAAFFGWTFTDAGLDTFRTIAQAVVPDELEGDALKARNRAARSFALVGIIYCLVMTAPVLTYVVAHTDYTGSTMIVSLFLALVAGFANTRLGSEAGVAAAETVKEIHAEFSKRNYRTAQRMLLSSVIPLLFFLALDNLILPPECPTPGHIAATCPAKLPSYAARWQNSSAFKLFGAAGARVGHEADEAAAEIAKDDESDASEAKAPIEVCATETITFVNGIEDGDCKVIVRDSQNAKLVGACKAAIACGAIDGQGQKQDLLQKPKSAKKPHKVGGVEVDPSSPWGWACLAGAIGLVLLAILGWKEPKKEEEKKGGGGH